MATPLRYPVPARPHRVAQEIQRSRFIASVERAPTVEAAEAFVRRVSEEFADATHNCWAYVVGPPGSTARVGMSDDGEPHGTAGRPMLTTLLHSGVGDLAAVVTRYYGGTKLGTGGLVRAYGGTLRRALDDLPLGEHVEYAQLQVVIGYPSVAAVQQLLPAFEAELLGQEFLVDVALALRLPVGRAEAFCAAVQDATRGRALITADDETDRPPAPDRHAAGN
jgi:uncharacterized YigZ family protein